MKILAKEKIRQAIARSKPFQIAVAYIGIDWTDFIPDSSVLKDVIVSPTLGTNPKAILSLAKEIGWDKVFFLNELHAKIFLGHESAVVGSANLTQNGLSGQALIELCVEINSETGLQKIASIINDLKKRAKDQYQTTESKKMQIVELERTWNAAIANRVFPKMQQEQNHFKEFEFLKENHFYVIWYKPCDCEYSEDVKAIERVMVNDIHFAQIDEVDIDKWVLIWRITNSSKPHKTEHPRWMYIHDLYGKGIVDEGYEYPMVAVQRNDRVVPSPPPFEITKEVESAFKATVIKEEIAKYLIQDDREIFSLKYSLKGIPILIKQMKKYMSNNKCSQRKKLLG